MVLRGVPRGLEDRVRQVLLEINPSHQIVRILIHAADDSITEYRFNSQQEDVRVADQSFRFTAPQGTEITEDLTAD